jgi:hypothetical protein
MSAQIDIQKIPLQSIGEDGKIKPTFLIEEHTGFIVIKNVVLASVGVLQYLGKKVGAIGDMAHEMIGVYQSEEDLFSDENMRGCEHVVLTDEHPEDQVVLIFESNNFKSFGFSLSNAKRIGKYLVNDIKIIDKEAIDLILSGEELGFSPGYAVEYTPKKGVYKDEYGVEHPYGFEKHMVKINHIALTKNPRNKQTIFTDSEEKGEKKNMKRLVFTFGKDTTETITTDSVDEAMPLIAKQGQALLDLVKENEDLKIQIEDQEKTATDSTSKIEELTKQKEDLEKQIADEKKKTADATAKAANDELLKDAIEFAKVQQIDVAQDSADDVEAVLKTVIGDSADTDGLDLAGLKAVYGVMKKANSADTTGMYKGGGVADSKDDTTYESSLRNYYKTKSRRKN